MNVGRTDSFFDPAAFRKCLCKFEIIVDPRWTLAWARDLALGSLRTTAQLSDLWPEMILHGSHRLGHWTFKKC